MYGGCLNKKFISISKRASKGSFLLEALIAVTILAVSLVVIVRSHLGALQAQVLAKDYSLATLLLEREMIELVENGYIESGINEQRNLEEPYTRFTFLLKTTAAGNEYYFDKLNEVDAALVWTAGQKKHRLSVSTLIFAK
jgi:type II secretory pathway pseudopilin PulG